MQQKQITTFFKNIDYNPRKINDNVKFTTRFFRIFGLYLMAYIPIIISHILLFTNKEIISSEKSMIFEAIGYVQTLIFVVINYGIFIICQIITKLQKELDLSHRKQQPKKVVDTGMVFLLTIVISLISIFIVTSVIFAELKAKNNNHTVSQYVYQYTFLFIGYLFFLLIGHYFLYISIVSGFHWIKIFVGCLFSLIIEILLGFIFIYYVDQLEKIICMAISSLIVVTIRCIIFWLLYLFKISYFNHFESKKIYFNKNLYLGLFKASLLTSIFSIGFMIVNIVQTIFIVMSNKFHGDHFNYLYTNDGNSILLMAKINVYNFIYLFFCSSKALGLTINDYENTNNVEYWTRIQRAKKLRKINLWLNLINLTICLIFCLLIRNIIKELFQNFNWINEIANNLPSTINHLQNNLELIIKISQTAFIIATFSYFLMEISINLRIITFRLFGRNYWLFTFIILGYLFFFTLITYLLVFQAYNIFYGLNGYVFSYAFYALYCLTITYLFDSVRQYKKYIKHFNHILNNPSISGFIFKRIWFDWQITQKQNEQETKLESK